MESGNSSTDTPLDPRWSEFVGDTPRRTLARPAIRAGAPITDYPHERLVQIVEWIESDEQRRSDAEILEVMFDEMGYTPELQTARVRASITHAITMSRQRV